jgi:hypothetical protein
MSPNLTHSFLTIYKIIMFKIDERDSFSCAQGRRLSFGGQKDHFF